MRIFLAASCRPLGVECGLVLVTENTHFHLEAPTLRALPMSLSTYHCLEHLPDWLPVSHPDSLSPWLLSGHWEPTQPECGQARDIMPPGKKIPNQ